MERELGSRREPWTDPRDARSDLCGGLATLLARARANPVEALDDDGIIRAVSGTSPSKARGVDVIGSLDIQWTA
eukprot:4990057-Pyramimonas_sp.AAC.1